MAISTSIPEFNREKFVEMFLKGTLENFKLKEGFKLSLFQI